MIKCAVYARYSSENQREASIEDQIRKCREFAESKGWIILEEHIYYDKAKSGSSIAPRDNFKRLLEIANSGSAPFNYILVDDTSRVARNTIEALKVFADLRFMDINVFYVSQGIDTKQEFAEEMITVHGLVDSLYIRELGQKTKRGIEGQFLKGYSPGARHFGYKSRPILTSTKDRYGNFEIEGYELEIDPHEAEVIKEIFVLYGENGWSAKQIANYLNKKLKDNNGPKPPRGNFWSVSTILGSKSRGTGILNNELYKGKLIWNKTTKTKNIATGKKRVIINTPDKWLSVNSESLRIISDELWGKVKQRQKIVENKTTGKFTKAKFLYSKNLLTPFSKCGHCGGTFGIVSGGEWGKYGCTTNWNKGSDVCNNQLKINKLLFEETVVSIIVKKLSDKKIISESAHEIKSNLKNLSIFSPEQDKTELENKLSVIKKEIENMIYAIKNGFISDTLRENLNKAEIEKKEIENKLTFLEINSNLDLSKLFTVEDLKSYFDKMIESIINTDTTKQVISDIVEKIIVYVDSYGTAIIEIHENSKPLNEYIVQILNQKDPRIRLQTGTRFIPYTSHVFKCYILPNKNLIMEEEI